jgi:hypothetical protein
MSWSTPRTWAYGELVNETLLNQEVRDNPKYLHGDTGDVTLAAGLILPNTYAYKVKDSGGTARALLYFDGSDNVLLVNGGAAQIQLKNQAASTTLMSLTDAGVVTVPNYVQQGANSYRSVLHVTAGAVHAERGTVACSGSVDTAVSFTKAYSAAPVITGAVQNGGQSYAVDIVSPTTTGFSVAVYNAANGRSAKTIGWQSLGATA